MPSGTLRLGFGSNHSSLRRAVRIAVSPTNQVFRSGCRKTADGMTSRPSTMNVLAPRSSATAATVFVVPKSMASTQSPEGANLHTPNKPPLRNLPSLDKLSDVRSEHV